MTLQLSPATEAVKKLWQGHEEEDDRETALAECYIAALRADADSQIEALSKHVATSAIHEQVLCACEDGHAQDMEEAASIERERDFCAAAWRELAHLVAGASLSDTLGSRLRTRMNAHRHVAARNGWHELGADRGEVEVSTGERFPEAAAGTLRGKLKDTEEQLATALSTIAVLQPKADAWDEDVGSEYISEKTEAAASMRAERLDDAQQAQQNAEERLAMVEAEIVTMLPKAKAFDRIATWVCEPHCEDGHKGDNRLRALEDMLSHIRRFVDEALGATPSA